MAVKARYGRTVRTLAWNFQQAFHVFPREICLITGAPRSGTSAICDWLGAQRGISAFPESRIMISAHRFMEEARRFQNLEKDRAMLEDLIRSLVCQYYSNSRLLLGKGMVVEKEPLEPIAFPGKDYDHFLANTRRIFPGIKIILLVRDPIATIWSMQNRSWGNSLSSQESRRFSLEDYAENWCVCADLVARHHATPNTHVVPFGRIIQDTQAESKRIFDFLNIRRGIPFAPRSTKQTAFTKEEREKIKEWTQPLVDRLASLGFSDLA